MKETIINKLYKIKRFDDCDFLKSMQDIVYDTNRVIASYEYLDENDDCCEVNDDYDFEKDQDALNKLYTENFLDDVVYHVYVMYIKDEPIAYAIYSQKDDTNSYVLEFIHVSKHWTAMGNGTILLQFSAKDLKSTFDAQEILATINKRNLKSLYLHMRFANDNNLDCYVNDYDDRITYHMDISNLNVKCKTGDLSYE